MDDNIAELLALACVIAPVLALIMIGEVRDVLIELIAAWRHRRER